MLAWALVTLLGALFSYDGSLVLHSAVPACASPPALPPAERAPSHVSLTVSLAPLGGGDGLAAEGGEEEGPHAATGACYARIMAAASALAPSLLRLERMYGVHGGVRITTRLRPPLSGVAHALAPAEELQVLFPSQGDEGASSPTFALHALRTAAVLDRLALQDARVGGGAACAWGDDEPAAVWLSPLEEELMVDWKRCTCASAAGDGQHDAVCEPARLVQCACGGEFEEGARLACVLPRGGASTARTVAAELLLLLPPEDSLLFGW